MAIRIQEGTKPRIDIGFRPGLILFVDQAGEQICQQLKQIIQMTGFDETLHQCLAFVQIAKQQKPASDEEDASESIDDEHALEPDEDADEDSEEEIERLLQEEKAFPIPVVGDRFPDGDPDMPVDPDYLDALIARALKSIRLERRLIEIGEMGYPVPNPRPQIYIVGNARSKKLRVIHAMVQELLRQRGFATLVCYILDAYEASNASAARSWYNPLRQKESAYWQQQEVPNFCYFYEDQINHPTVRTVTEAESHYAAAETLFALIATGITPDMHFEQMMELQPNLTRYTNVGSMGTSLIIFPREAAQEYYSAYLGFTLLQQWQSDIDRELLPEPRRRQLQERARKDVEQVEQWIKDVKPRPNANGDAKDVKASKPHDNDEGERQGNSWPSLDILKGDNPVVSPRALTQQRGLHRDLRERSRALFKLFHTGDVAEEVRKLRKRRETWTNAVDKRVGRARDASNTWEQTAEQAWIIAGILASATVKQAVDVLWSNRENGVYGFEMARTYIDTYDEQLSKLQDYLGRLREIHQRDYEGSMNAFESLSTGEWLIQPNDSNIINSGDAGATTQVGPRARGAVFESAQSGNSGGISGVDITGGGAELSGSNQFPSEREERIGGQLAQRILWLQDQVPSIPTQVTISLPPALAIVLSGLALYPQGNLFFALSLIAGVIAVVGAMNWLFWKRYQKRVENARRDLLRFYRRIFAYHCEQLEDELRDGLISPLRMRTLAMRERLENISAFIGAVQFQLEQRYGQVRRDLFSNPSGVRDIYIANGERLQNQRRNTIEDFAAQVTRTRESRPIEEWHRSLLKMREHLIESFRTLPESIIEMDVDQARDHIHAFTSDITAAYLQGPLVDVRRALDKYEVWQEALHRAGSPLYRAEVGIREPQMLFVCGQHANLNKGESHWPGNATPVLLSDRYDWVLVSALFRGGTPPAFDPDIHFPPKHILTEDAADVEDDEDFLRPARPLRGKPDDKDDDTRGSSPPPPYVDEKDKIDDTISVISKSRIPTPPPPPVDDEVESKLADSFKRYERHLAYYAYAETPSPAIAINDRDLELPVPFRLAEIQADKDALRIFVNKHLDGYHESASRLAADPDNGLHALYTSWRCFAARNGQRALGLPAERLLPWPEQLQRLFGHVQHPDLQRLVKEDLTLTSSVKAGPSSAPAFSNPPPNNQNYGNTAQPDSTWGNQAGPYDVPPIHSGQFRFGQSPNRLGNGALSDKQDSKKMKAHRLRPLSESDPDTAFESGSGQQPGI